MNILFTVKMKSFVIINWSCNPPSPPQKKKTLTTKHKKFNKSWARSPIFIKQAIFGVCSFIRDT